jgi:hypothetical protein
VHWFLRYHVTLWVIVLALTGLAAVVALRLPTQDQASGPGVPRAKVKADVRQTPRIPVVKPHKEPSFQYEEETRTLETRVKELDLALIQTLVVYGYDPAGIEHGNVETRYSQGQVYHFQRLKLALPGDMDGFLASLRSNIRQLVRGGGMHYDASARQIKLMVDHLPTHVLEFASARKPRDVHPGIHEPSRSRMVIVVDDLGRSLGAGRHLADLSFPVTFSVMPHEPHSQALAELARNHGQEVIVHLPMQPESYPRTNPGPGALLVDMSPRVVTKTLLEDLARVPGARGANNHMGSRFTRDKKGMETVMKVFRDRHLFFLDSMTTPDSCGQEVTSTFHVPYLRRHVFLDNVRDEKAILFQLRKAQRLAQKRGTCIAIGHPYPETLDALKTWETMRDPGVSLVRLEDLLP